MKYVVLVGDDRCIPYGRVVDNTAYANEREYTTTFLGAPNNQYLSTYGLGYLPTDDPWATQLLGTGPYVPELGVGRLVEKPNQIVASSTSTSLGTERSARPQR